MNYDQNSMSISKKHNKIEHMKRQQNELTYTSIKKTWNLSSMRWVTGRQKDKKNKFKITFLFWKQLIQNN